MSEFKFHSDIPLIYVAGPYSAPSAHMREINIQGAWRLGAQVAAVGAMPIVPHMSSAHLDGLQSQEWWIAATLELMKRCDAVIFTPNYVSSKGSLGEEDEARRLKIPRFYSVVGLDLWLHGPSREHFKP